MSKPIVKKKRKRTKKKKDEPEYELGVAGYSPLLDLPKSNMIEDTPFDYMHQGCEGVMKTFGTTWKKFYLSKKQIQEIDDRLAKIKMPNEVSRATRSFKEVTISDNSIS